MLDDDVDELSASRRLLVGRDAQARPAHLPPHARAARLGRAGPCRVPRRSPGQRRGRPAAGCRRPRRRPGRGHRRVRRHPHRRSASPVAGRASAGLVLAAFLWGSTFLVVQDATEDAPVMPFLASRFLIGATSCGPSPGGARAATEMAATAWRRGALPRRVRLPDGRASSTRRRRPRRSSRTCSSCSCRSSTRDGPAPPTGGRTIGSVAVAVVGLVLLSGGAPGFGKGEWLTLGCAPASLRTSLVLDRVTLRNDPVRLTFIQVLTVGLGCLVPGWCWAATTSGCRRGRGALFTGVGATAVAVLCMVWAQRVVPPTRTAIILLLEPVFAALLGYVAGERLGGRGLLARPSSSAVLWIELVPDRTGGSRIPTTPTSDPPWRGRGAVRAGEVDIEDGTLAVRVRGHRKSPPRSSPARCVRGPPRSVTRASPSSHAKRRGGTTIGGRSAGGLASCSVWWAQALSSSTVRGSEPPRAAGARAEVLWVHGSAAPSSTGTRGWGRLFRSGRTVAGSCSPAHTLRSPRRRWHDRRVSLDGGGSRVGF